MSMSMLTHVHVNPCYPMLPHVGDSREAGRVPREEAASPSSTPRQRQVRRIQAQGRLHASASLGQSADVFWLAGQTVYPPSFILLTLGPVGIAWAPEGVSDEQRDQMQSFAQRAAAGE